MPARVNRPPANRGGPRLLWAAALTALAPDALAHALTEEPTAARADPAPPRDNAPGGEVSWSAFIAACAQANAPLAEPGEASPYAASALQALADRFGAPLVAGAAAPAHDPWIGADATPEAIAIAHAPLIALDSHLDGVGEDGGGTGEDGLRERAPDVDPLAPQPARRRPGQSPQPAPASRAIDPGAVAPPQLPDLFSCEPSLAGGGDHLMPCAPPVADRWRLAQNLGLVKARWWDPYNQNTLKGDRPVPFLGEHWFFVGAAISDTVIEPRSFPVPFGVQTTARPGSLDAFGDATSLALSQTFILSGALIEGSTAFKPQDLEFRVTVAGNVNHAEVEERRILYVRPEQGTQRTDSFVGVQELFAEKHLRNVSDRYDFDSLRVGIQPFSSDFRGFLFQDNQLGVRLFGTRNNNRIQYNLAAFARVEKDTNSGLNDLSDDLREDYVLLANVYRQDAPVPGVTSQITAVWNANREKGDIEVDTNGFPVRPALIGDLRTRDYDVGYLGYNADGRVGRLNLTASAYYAFGENRNSAFTGKESVIRAYFAAVEPSMDFDWIRVRGSALYASGDADVHDDTEEGFDAIFENPQFAGADTSYWIRQSVPFIGGGRAVNLNGRNGILNSLRSSKEQGQSNFTNPGVALVGVGADVDVLPQLRVSTSVNHLSFAETAPLEALRMQGAIRKDIGWDVSAAATYRPGFIQNFVFRLSAAALAPGDGFKDLFDNRDRKDRYYSVLFNATLSY
ncbi:MAG: hypothetical protein NW200_06285 [Hyphomonadaceae bacterium]|nr:hypothetical protein [Hyphomonadaceae bacterium]